MTCKYYNEENKEVFPRFICAFIGEQGFRAVRISDPIIIDEAGKINGISEIMEAIDAAT